VRGEDAVKLYAKMHDHEPDLPADAVVPDDATEIYYHWHLRAHVAVTPQQQQPIGRNTGGVST
jgi:hypothetical protein